MQFWHILLAAMALLQREGRITYRALQRIFDLDDACLEDLRAELIFAQRVATDEDGRVLVWTGAAALPRPAATAPPREPAAAPATLPPLLTPTTATGDGPTVSTRKVPQLVPATVPTASLEASVPEEMDEVASAAPLPTRSAPEAERRQLTVMFCDLADSTQLSQQLDPEDLREVIRAYQQTSAEVIQRFDGYIAQHLGDGLLIYFGWPVAHEDDAQRALHAGLGIVEAITATLNPRLEQDKRVQLAVRLGIHTGPVVVGEMGGGGRHENLATGETVNIAARLEGLATPNTVVISQVTERLVRGAFILEGQGRQVLKGVAEPVPVFRVLGPMTRQEDESGSAAVPFLVGRDFELLREEADRYVLTGPLVTVAIPDTLQDSLMARLDQLNTAKEVAQLGAVLGREFAYDLIRAISSQDDVTLQAGLAQLVEAELLYHRGRPPRARYLFKHALIQDAAYQSLLKRTRQQVHQRIAQVLEGRFPETADQQPELLAHHLTDAGCYEQAIVYWQRAGERARQGSAHIEAIAHLTKALELLAIVPETDARIQQELVLRLALGPSLIAVRGYASQDVEQVYSRARVLCQQMGETRQLFPMLWGLWGFYVVGGNHQGAREVGEELLRLAQREQDPIYLTEAHLTLGGALFCLAEFVPASELMEQGADLYDPQQHHAHTALFAADIGVFCPAWASHPLWHLGYPERGLARSRQALDLAEKLAHPYTLVVALDYAAIFHQFRREADVAYERAEAAIAICTEQKFAYYLGWAMVIKGWALAAQGAGEEGIVTIHQGLQTLRATGAKRSLPYYLALLADAYGQSGQTNEGLRILADAFTEAQNIGEPWWEAELHRLKGALLLASSMSHATEAEACFRQALDIARRQQSKALELRTATSLSRLWQQQDRPAQARQLLVEVYARFTEGFDTVDLKEASALLAELGP
jgi:class 3 adenylate cyclase/predicted ATPase